DGEGDRHRSGQDEVGDLDPPEGTVGQQAPFVAGGVEAFSGQGLSERGDHEERAGDDAVREERLCGPRPRITRLAGWGRGSSGGGGTAGGVHHKAPYEDVGPGSPAARTTSARTATTRIDTARRTFLRSCPRYLFELDGGRLG